MINKEFKAQGTKYQVLLDLRVYCRELGGLKVMIVAHVCTVCALSAIPGNHRNKRYNFFAESP